MLAEVARARIPFGAAILAAVLSGLLLGYADQRGLLLVLALALTGFALVTLEYPIVCFGALALVLALAPEDYEDNRLGLTKLVHDTGAWIFTAPVVLLCLLTAALLVRPTPGPRWPGLPATVVTALLGTAVASALLFAPPVAENLFILRPVLVLFLATLCGYWIVGVYGVQLPLRLLVAAAVLALPVGLYHIASGYVLSYYDASFPFLIGVTGVLVLFRAVDIGFARWPFLILGALVMVLSLRRAALLSIAICILITGIVTRRGGFWLAGLILGAGIITVEALMPGAVFSRVEHLASYFTGASGQDANVNYRRYETSNAWINVTRHEVMGIGPSADWTVYRTFDGKFHRIGPGYLHNSYLWVWLRFTFLGLLLYVSFFLATGVTLVRRSAPIVSVIVGAAILGLAVGLGTASWLTTTVRWPLIVGLFLGIALAARRGTDPTEASLGADRDAAAADPA